MAFRVRSSKFRHVFGNAVKKEHCYDCIKITKNAHDSNYCAVNPKFVAVVTESAGGGAFLILPLERVRKTSCVYVLNFLPSANEVAARNPPGQTLPPPKQTATTADDSNYCAVNPKFGFHILLECILVLFLTKMKKKSRCEHSLRWLNFTLGGLNLTSRKLNLN